MANRDLMLLERAVSPTAPAALSTPRVPVQLIGMSLAGGAVAATLSYVAFRWFLTQNPEYVGAVSAALGVGGVLAAALGFALTFWQLWHTAAAAEAAAAAVRDVKRDYSSFDAMAELSAARGLNESIRTSLAAHDRESAKARYDRLRESLVRIAASPHALQEHTASDMKDEAAKAMDALATLRDIGDSTAVPWNEMISSLEKLDSYLISVSQILRDSIRG